MRQRSKKRWRERERASERIVSKVNYENFKIIENSWPRIHSLLQLFILIFLLYMETKTYFLLWKYINLDIYTQIYRQIDEYWYIDTHTHAQYRLLIIQYWKFTMPNYTFTGWLAFLKSSSFFLSEWTWIKIC